MKKLMIIAAVSLMMFSCADSPSAYTEEEKQSQDSLDQAAQDAEFESLEDDDSTSNSTDSIK
jgi:starvation-inducible outer membrane lipoprotein